MAYLKRGGTKTEKEERKEKENSCNVIRWSLLLIQRIVLYDSDCLFVWMNETDQKVYPILFIDNATRQKL